LGTLSPPVNAGAAQNLEAEWNIDALTTTHQVSNNDLRCTTTPYLVAQRRLSTAANFAPATPVSLTLSAQLADVSHNLTIDRCEVITI
jgi:hypothetical protein